MDDNKVNLRIEHQVIGDEGIDFLVVFELHNNVFNPNLTYRANISDHFNEDRKIFKLYPFVHN